MKRVRKLMGEELPYSLSERQLRFLRAEAFRRLDGNVFGPIYLTELEVALAGAKDMEAADAVASQLFSLANANRFEQVQAMLDRGEINALAILSLIDVAGEAAVTELAQHQVQTRYGRVRLAKAWVLAAWDMRGAGRFETRDAFVEWCFSHCPHSIAAEHERVRDKWIPRGKASVAGPNTPKN